MKRGAKIGGFMSKINKFLMILCLGATIPLMGMKQALRHLQSRFGHTPVAMAAIAGQQHSGSQNGDYEQTGYWQQQAALAALSANTVLTQTDETKKKGPILLQPVHAVQALSKIQQAQKQFDQIIRQRDFDEQVVYDLMDQGAELTYDNFDQMVREGQKVSSDVHGVLMGSLIPLFECVGKILHMKNAEKRDILLPIALLYLHEKNLLQIKDLMININDFLFREVVPLILGAYEKFEQTSTMISTDNYKDWYFLIQACIKYMSCQDCPTIINLCLQQHARAINNAKLEIENAAELTSGQKSEIIHIINKISWNKILDQNYDRESLLEDLLHIFGNLSLLYEKGKVVDISNELLLKYFPLGLWLNSLIFDYTNLSQHSNEWFTLLKMKRKLSYSEQLFINLVLDKKLGLGVGLYHLVPHSENSTDTRSMYVNSGFAGQLQKNKMLEQLATLEKDFAQKGYTVFVHGRAWEWNFLNDIWNFIRDVKFNECDYDRISLRQRDPQNCNIEQLLQWRQELVQSGAAVEVSTGTDKEFQDTMQAEVTFVNLSALSNCGYYGECTGTYVAENHSIAAKGAALQKANDLIAKHGLELYMPEWLVAEFYKKHQKISGLGETLCIAVKNQHVDEMMYPAKSGGLINNITKVSIPLWFPLFSCFILKLNLGAKPASEFICEMKKFVGGTTSELDKDRRFYCMGVSDLPGEYGDKYVIKSVAVTDPELYAQYVAELNALFKQVKAQLAQEK
jgi:hypothetical protein